MKIIKGNNRLHEYVDNFMKNNEKQKFIIIDDKNLDYKYSANDLLKFISNDENWENNIKTCLQEKEDYIFILFTNTDFNNENLKYFDKEFNYKDKNIIFVFNDNCGNTIEDYEVMSNGLYIDDQLKYPIDSFISWKGKYYKVISNRDDIKAIVKDIAGDSQRFYFDFGKEKAKLVTDKEKIKELNESFTRK